MTNFSTMNTFPTTMTTFPITITIYDVDNVLIKSYPNVPIPLNPVWTTDAECVNYLQKFCPALEFNVVYGITPLVDVEPLYPFEGAIYPTISPIFRNSITWDLKQTQRFANSNRRMDFASSRTVDNRVVDMNALRLLHVNTNRRLHKLETAFEELKADLAKSKHREVVIKSNM